MSCLVRLAWHLLLKMHIWHAVASAFALTPSLVLFPVGEACVTSRAVMPARVQGLAALFESGGRRRRVCGPRVGVGAVPGFPGCAPRAGSRRPACTLVCSQALWPLCGSPCFSPQRRHSDAPFPCLDNLHPSQSSSSIVVSRNCSPVAQVGAPFPCTEPHCHPLTRLRRSLTFSFLYTCRNSSFCIDFSLLPS